MYKEMKEGKKEKKTKEKSTNHIYNNTQHTACVHENMVRACRENQANMACRCFRLVGPYQQSVYMLCDSLDLHIPVECMPRLTYYVLSQK